MAAIIGLDTDKIKNLCRNGKHDESQAVNNCPGHIAGATEAVHKALTG